jgi:tubulysin polyketide synthase-like protein
LIAESHRILAANGDRLDIDAPDSVLTDDLLATLRARKAELLDLLAGENPETHNTTLFDVITPLSDVVVEVTYYTGERLRIPQQSTPQGWEPPFEPLEDLLRAREALKREKR